MKTFGDALRENADFQALRDVKLKRLGWFNLINAGESISGLFGSEEAFERAWRGDTRHTYSDPADNFMGRAYAEEFAEYMACWAFVAVCVDRLAFRMFSLKRPYGGFEASAGGVARADGIALFGKPAGTNPDIPECTLTFDIGTLGSYQSFRYNGFKDWLAKDPMRIEIAAATGRWKPYAWNMPACALFGGGGQLADTMEGLTGDFLRVNGLKRNA